jgi:N-acetylneuraminic acid mutarotase
MKKLIMYSLYSLFTFHFSLSTLKAQGTWTSRDTLPHDTNAMYQGIPGFSIGSYGYAGIGEHSGPYIKLDDFWQFNPSNNSWAKKASFPGMARVAPACFVICDKAYLVTGSVSNGRACVTECWEYDATNNTWTQKANFPGSARTYAVGFAINGKGFVGTGANELSDFRKDFYRYNPDSNTWTRVADFGGIARSGACGFSVNGKGYVCFGQDSTIKFYKDIWQYDPGTNTWSQKSDYPSEGILSPSGFVICNNIYVGIADSEGTDLDRRFWKYNTIINTWSQETNFSGNTTFAGTSFAINDTGYYGFGDDSIFTTKNKFYKFFAGDTCMNTDTCKIGEGYWEISNDRSINIYPNPANTILNLNFKGQQTGLATLIIMDITGREISTYKLSINNHQITTNVSFLSSGMYFINIKNKGINVTQKFIKQ